MMKKNEPVEERPYRDSTVLVECENNVWQCARCKRWWLYMGTLEKCGIRFCPFCGREIVKIQRLEEKRKEG